MDDVLDLLGWLERWYQEQCDGEWEHDCGLRIETLDNPGWLVSVELRHVEPEAAPRSLVVLGKPPCAENGNEGGPVWMTCEVDGRKFVGAGDPTQLRAILVQLRTLIEAEAT
jgi:hypothetical protein